MSRVFTCFDKHLTAACGNYCLGTGLTHKIFGKMEVLITKATNSSNPKRDVARSIVNGLKPGDRVYINEGDYEITVGMPSDIPDELTDEIKGDGSVYDPGAWFE